jgi:CBS-domain-containing membrane protein
MAFRKRATGARRAVATPTAEQRAALQTSDKGEVQVAVTVTDEAGVLSGFIARTDILRAVAADPPLDLWSGPAVSL